MDSIDTTDTGRGGSAVKRQLQLRALLAEYRTELLVGFVLLVVLGGWLSYGAYAAPPEETDQRLEDAWTATGTLSHEATVTELTAVYANGTVLEDEPLYYTSIAPELDGEFTGGYEADSARNVDVDVSVDLAYRAVEPGDGDGTVYWSQRESLASVSEANVDPDERVTAAFTVDVTEVAAAIDEIEADLGASPGETEIVLEIEREIEGEIDGDYRTAADQYRVPIEYSGSTYAVDDAGAGAYDESHDEEYETVTSTAPVGPVRSVGGPLLLVVGLGGVIGLVVASRRLSDPSPAEREWLTYQEDRERFDEVITTARLPVSELEFGEGESDGEKSANEDEAGEEDGKPTAEYATVDTLADLAGFGIDVGTGIVFDRRTERYVVRHEGTAYVYDPPTLESVLEDDGADDTEFRFFQSAGALRSGGETVDEADFGDRLDELRSVVDSWLEHVGVGPDSERGPDEDTRTAESSDREETDDSSVESSDSERDEEVELF
ncbi:DUF5305 family protein [Natronobacterium texcoconense]|uniref:DUF5305 domain-containing protein n=1 Tax=Natronobacterium texcoconense TaxID=1095778 RepID=A0A1H1IM74_NATTX|nr:DUF5305 family protein [Natronobacterium texcoconense]SDR38764.1 hypothetical protein SAMN04489842_3621 [Natronobacterium texcoconense]